MTNKITIENINGVPHTVVWFHDIAKYYYTCQYIESNAGGYFISYPKNLLHIATALPPLPRNPTADDAKLLYLYESHGLRIIGKRAVYIDNEECSFGGYWKLDDEDGWDLIVYARTNRKKQITYAINEAGERVEIAIIDKETEK